MDSTKAEGWSSFSAEEIIGVSTRAYSHWVIEKETDEWFSAYWEGGRGLADYKVPVPSADMVVISCALPAESSGLWNGITICLLVDLVMPAGDPVSLLEGH